MGIIEFHRYAPIISISTRWKAGDIYLLLKTIHYDSSARIRENKFEEICTENKIIVFVSRQTDKSCSGKDIFLTCVMCNISVHIKGCKNNNGLGA